MLTVWCMNTGNHAPDSEVHTLKRMVDRHLSIDHEFVCISDNDIQGIDTIRPINDLQGWWGKTNLFAPSVSRERNLWLDLDVTITQAIDALVRPDTGAQLSICKNWAQSGWGGCQSSVMYWEGTDAQIIHDEFDHNIAYWPPRNDGGKLWGDQEHITVLRDSGRLDVEYFAARHVVSYKYHCRQGLPPDSLVQVFHGKPNPGDVSDEWVRLARAETVPLYTNG